MKGYDVFCGWPAWGQLVWTVAFMVIVLANGLLIGWWARGRETND